MATWVTVDAEDLIPEQIEQALGLVEDALEIVSAILEGASGVVDTIATLVDLLAAALDGGIAFLLELLDNIIDDLRQTQVSALIVKPVFSRYDEPGGLKSFGRVLKQSLSDASDFNRPTFDETDTSGGIIFQINAPSFAEIAVIAEALQSIFGDRWQDIIDFANSLPGRDVPAFQPDITGTVTSIPEGVSAKTQFRDAAQAQPNGIDLKTGQRIRMVTGANAGADNIVGAFSPAEGGYTMRTPWRYRLEVGDQYILANFKSGTPPNWLTARAVDLLPPLAEAVRFLANVRDNIQPVSDYRQLISLIASVIQQKLALIQVILGQLQEIIDVLQALGQIVNLNALPIPFGVGGNGRFIQEFELSDNKPPVDDDNVSLGLVVYGGAGTSAVFQTLFGFTGAFS